MAERVVSNPLALAALSVLAERPMHPYEIATTMRGRDTEFSSRLNYSSLYAVMTSLERAGFVAATGRIRVGRRPARTVYELTDAGRAELLDWLRELVETPERARLGFEAALSLLRLLAPENALRALRARLLRLREDVDRLGDRLRVLYDSRPTRLSLIDAEFVLTMWRAERDWLAGILPDLEGGALTKEVPSRD